jgi:hypothetical protein
MTARIFDPEITLFDPDIESVMKILSRSKFLFIFIHLLKFLAKLRQLSL